MTRTIKTVPARANCAGFTLVETMVALSIMAFIMVGAMDLFINSLRYASRSTAEVFASQDAAVAMRNVDDSVRESLWLALPDDGAFPSATPGFSAMIANFPSLSGYSASQFIARNSPYTADAALYLAAAPIDNSPTFNSDFQSNISTTGLATPYNLYNRLQASTSGLMIYRADSNGTPDPTGGPDLWELSTGSNPAVNRALITSVAPQTWNAVQFDRPYYSANTPYHYQVEVKITSGYWSAVNGVQTNEATNGASTTQLVGRCVSMRDHEGATGTHYPNAELPTTGGNFKFQTAGGNQAG